MESQIRPKLFQFVCGYTPAMSLVAKESTNPFCTQPGLCSTSPGLLSLATKLTPIISSQALAECAAKQTAAMAAAHLMVVCIFISLGFADLFVAQQPVPTPLVLRLKTSFPGIWGGGGETLKDINCADHAEARLRVAILHDASTGSVSRFLFRHIAYRVFTVSAKAKLSQPCSVCAFG